MTKTHPHFAPGQFRIINKVARSLITKGSILPRLYFAFFPDKGGEAIRPGVQLAQGVRVSRQVLRLVITVLFVPANLDVVPEAVRHFYPAISALPDQRGITVALVLE